MIIRFPHCCCAQRHPITIIIGSRYEVLDVIMTDIYHVSRKVCCQYELNLRNDIISRVKPDEREKYHFHSSLGISVISFNLRHKNLHVATNNLNVWMMRRISWSETCPCYTSLLAFSPRASLRTESCVARTRWPQINGNVARGMSEVGKPSAPRRRWMISMESRTRPTP